VLFNAPQALSDVQSLGQKIFTDKNLSEPAGTACANCHDGAKGFSSLNGSKIGVALGALPNALGLRNPMQNAYSAFVPAFTFRVVDGDTDPMGGLFWDGRAANLQQQALAPFLSTLEMNNASGAQVVAKIAKSPYANQFKSIFGANIFNNPSLAYQKVGEAIAAFEASSVLNPFNSKYDRFVQGNAQLTPSEKNGMSVFMNPDKGNCASCHLMNPSSKIPSDNLFTDFAFYATGIPRNTAIPRNANPSFFDLGLCGPERSKPALTSNVPSNITIEKFCGTFRIPSLRNVALREVYMHNGFFKNLKDVVSFYATRNTNPKRWYGPQGVPNDLPTAYLANIISDRVPFNKKLNDAPALSETEINDVVAFLKTLSDDTPPKANPSAPAQNPAGFAGFNPFIANPPQPPSPVPLR
jgi:cytochrome c peroxidase